MKEVKSGIYPNVKLDNSADISRPSALSSMKKDPYIEDLQEETQSLKSHLSVSKRAKPILKYIDNQIDISNNAFDCKLSDLQTSLSMLT